MKFHGHEIPKFITVKEFGSEEVRTGYNPVGYVDAKDLEDLFEILNIRHPDHVVATIRNLSAVDRGKFRDEDYVYPYLHTSMSVGDVAIECDTNKHFYCAPCGWNELK
jgi:hypothetical protein